MSDRFTYYALYPRDYRTDPPAGLLAYEHRSATEPIRVIGWDHFEQTWNIAVDMFGVITVEERSENRFQIVDRATAERIARENLGADLPSEEELSRIGERAAQERRPPR